MTHQQMISVLRSAEAVLLNMTKENYPRWWEFWIPRWEISDEPLRRDAKHVLPMISQLILEMKLDSYK